MSSAELLAKHDDRRGRPENSDQQQQGGPAASGRKRLYALDGMRLMAALGVLSFHWTAYVDIGGIWPRGHSPAQVMPAVNHVAAYGWLGVNLFFVISGFVICMSCWGKSVGQFFVSRVVRLYPAYWAAVLLTSTVLLTMGAWIRHGAANGLDAQAILANLTMLETPLGIRQVDGVYWTLWAELRFYVLFGVLAAFGLTYRKVVAFCGVWMFVAILSIQAKSELLTTIAMPQYAPFFIAGMAIFLMYKYGPNLLLWGIVGFSWLIALAQVRPIEAMYVNVLNHGLNWYVVAAGFTVAMGLVLAAALGLFDWANWKWLTVAGALTYPLYLIHQEAGWTLIHFGLGHGLGVVGSLGTAFAVVVVVAYLIHRLIERPLSKPLKKGLDRSMVSLREASRAR
ncbi:acyltransferase family protein [Streptacidiphilus albus]|jgi:peptidoglycan/LPS O-acetylase OafA/YrhL|uniref:acyltransferase family protein n=1 Tax=Streptacidiphilus albus TaxID=105425 RepID=UPI00068F1DD7|nr:acyltransferase [Streptacidiphilus albus]